MSSTPPIGRDAQAGSFSARSSQVVRDPLSAMRFCCVTERPAPSRIIVPAALGPGQGELLNFGCFSDYGLSKTARRVSSAPSLIWSSFR